MINDQSVYLDDLIKLSIFIYYCNVLEPHDVFIPPLFFKTRYEALENLLT